MHFRPDASQNFLEIFGQIREQLVNFPGCRGVTLLRDIQNPDIFFTYSNWLSEADLEVYRNSDFFADTWEKTKALFAEKAEAWTVKEVG